MKILSVFITTTLILGLGIQINGAVSSTRNSEVNFTVNTVRKQSSQFENINGFNYINEIIEALTNQSSSSEERICLNRTITLLQGVQNNTIWSTWAWESVNPVPVGQLFGTRHHLGNYDECMNSPWFDDYPELHTQYCLADIELHRTEVDKNVSKVDPFASTLEYLQYHTRYSRRVDLSHWGICIPAVCNSDFALQFMKLMLSRSHLAIPGVVPVVTIHQCQAPDQPIVYDWLFISFILFVISSVVTCLVCTCISVTKTDNSDSIIMYVVRAFCIVYNSKSLLKVTKDGLEVLYGIRFLSVVFIVMAHQIMYYNIGPISNGWKADRELDSGMANLIVHDDVLVDTFFMMSGLLVMRAFMYFKKLPNLFIVILKRYLRLVPGLAVAIFYICTALKYTGDGPLWPSYVEMETGYCNKNWWVNLVLLNNFIDLENACYHNTWYIPCDFQMFLTAVLMFWIYCKSKRLGIVTILLVAVASVVVPALIVHYYDLPPVTLMVYENLLNGRLSQTFNIFYVKTYNRFGAYFVGMAAGYIFATYKPTDANNRISKKTAILGVTTGLSLMLGVMLYGAHLHRSGWGQAEGIIFATLNRPVWSFGLALLVLSCAFGNVPVVTPILSWYPWVPLSRLVFGIYLTHGLVIYRNIYVTRNLNHHDQGNIAIDTLGVTMMSVIIAYCLFVFVEAPINNLFAIAIAPRHLLKKVMNQELTKDDLSSNINQTKNQFSQELHQRDSKLTKIEDQQTKM